MAKNFSNVMDYKVVANNGFQFNVNVYGVNNLGNRKWMLKAVEVISEYFTFTEGADEGLIVNVVVNTHEIIVKAEFNGKKYFALPIQPRYGKNQIKDILDNMGVIKDVIDVYTNNLVKDIYDEDDYDDNEVVEVKIEQMDKRTLKGKIKAICEYALEEGKNTDWYNVIESFGLLEEEYDSVDGFQFLDEDIVMNLETLIDLVGTEELLGKGEKVDISKLMCIVGIYQCVNRWNTLCDFE